MRTRSAPAEVIALDLSEEDFKARVIDAATWHGWLVHHSRPARTARGWRTPVEGDAGLPDLVLARAGVVILAELKKRRAYPTPEQRRWLEQAGPHARLWRPADWPAILIELSAGRPS